MPIEQEARRKEGRKKERKKEGKKKSKFVSIQTQLPSLIIQVHQNWFIAGSI